MSAQLEQYYAKQPEPIQGCLLALKDIILAISPYVTHQRKFQIPFFYYNDKKICFLWVTRKKLLLGFVEDKKIHSPASGEKLKDKFEHLVIDPDADLPLELILEKIGRLIELYNR